MKRSIFNRLWAGVIVGLFVISAILAAQSTAEIPVKKMISANLNDEWVPVVGHFRVRVKPQNVIDVEIEGRHFDITNWTHPPECHNVKITWEVINTYSTSGSATVGYRIREYQRFETFKLRSFIEFMFTNNGNIYTPNDNKWMNPKNIEVVPNTNTSGEFIITVCFYYANEFTDMAEFLWAKEPFHFAWGGQGVFF